MHVRRSPRIGSPREGAMRESDFQSVPFEQRRPELRHLLALRDRVRGDEGDSRRPAPEVLASLQEPRRHVIQAPARGSQSGKDLPGTLLLGSAPLDEPAEWRIAQHKGTVSGRQDFRPVDLQSVAANQVRRLRQRNPHVRFAELQAQLVVEDVVHHPQGGLGDANRELPDLDPMELVHVHHRQLRRVEAPLA